jgi:hypothetical protein
MQAAKLGISVNRSIGPSPASNLLAGLTIMEELFDHVPETAFF